jgi:hypothetical protein
MEFVVRYPGKVAGSFAPEFLDSNNYVADARNGKFTLTYVMGIAVAETGSESSTCQIVLTASVTFGDPAAAVVTSRTTFSKTASSFLKKAVAQVLSDVTSPARTKRGIDQKNFCTEEPLQAKWKVDNAVDIVQPILTSNECIKQMAVNKEYLVSGTWTDVDGRRILRVKKCFGVATTDEFGFFSGQRAQYKNLLTLEKCK